MTGPLERARGLMRAAKRIVIVTGAGISAESGVPTFRGAAGLWRSYRPEDLATPEAFARDPALVWAWYQWRRGLIRACTPNAGHLALAGLALQRPGQVTIITQNVDGLHTEAARLVAGTRDPSPAEPIEVHGAIQRDRCSGCDRRTPAGYAADAGDVHGPPRCAACGGVLRPDVVWFGEALDAELIDRAFALAEAADLCLVVGTSAVVHPAASVPLATLRSGGVLIEVNPETTPLTTSATLRVPGAAGSVLPAMLDPG